MKPERQETLNVDSILCVANEYLLNTPDDYNQRREGMTDAIEQILLLANNYGGFRYLDADEMSHSVSGKSIGIIFDKSEERKHVFPDPTRRCYHLKTW